MTPLIKPSVIIVGSGRSGTSAVAKVCHEDLNICMGHFLKPADAQSPDGYYEDLVSHGLVRAMVDSYTAETYLKLMNHFHKDCYQGWGVKEPWALYVPKQTLVKLEPRLCIVALRDVEATVQSWLRCWKLRNPDREPTKEVADYYRNLTKTRQEAALNLPDLWANVVALDFTERVPKEDIISAVRNGLARNPSWQQEIEL